MDDTIPSAPDLVTYDEDTNDLSREKKRLEFRLRLLQTGKDGFGRIIYLMGAVFLLSTVYGIAMILIAHFNNSEISSSDIYTFALSAPALSFIIYIIIKRRNNNAFDRTASRLYEVEKELYEEQEREKRISLKENELLQKS